MLEGIDLRNVKNYRLWHFLEKYGSEIVKNDHGENLMTFYEIYLQGFIRLQYDT